MFRQNKITSWGLWHSFSFVVCIICSLHISRRDLLPYLFWRLLGKIKKEINVIAFNFSKTLITTYKKVCKNYGLNYILLNYDIRCKRTLFFDLSEFLLYWSFVTTMIHYIMTANVITLTSVITLLWTMDAEVIHTKLCNYLYERCSFFTSYFFRTVHSISF